MRISQRHDKEQRETEVHMRYLGKWKTPGNADELNLTNKTGRTKRKSH